MRTRWRVSPRLIRRSGTEQTLSTVVAPEAGDLVEVVLRQNSGGALNVNAFPEFSPEFSMVWLAPAPRDPGDARRPDEDAKSTRQHLMDTCRTAEERRNRLIG